MVRKLALSLAVASVIAAGQANALGLGEVRVNSALNEPLDAEIRLVQVRDLSAQQILPRMADIDEFSLAGLTKSRFLSDVRFQVKVAPDGSGSIHVTSSVPVQEPFLSFLMEVNWPQGRLVREYTLLLDPPVFDPAPVTTAINAPAATTPAASAQQPVAAPAQRSNIQTNVGGGEIFVKNNDTLYVLAKNNRPASDISIEQMMVAMQRKNPQLFPTSNINVMRAGQVMKLPTAEEARALTRKQAIAEAARQTAEWKASRRAAAAPKSEPKPEAKPDTTAADTQASGTAEGAPDASESQLKIVTAEKPAEMEESVSSDAAPEAEAIEVEGDTAVVDTGPSEREIELIQRNEDLENRLLVTQESVDKVSRENAELGEKLDSIQEQLAAMQRLIELKDQQMASLQAEMLKQVQEANKPKPSPVDEFINLMMANPLYLGGAGGVLLLLLALAALARRRKSADYDDEPAPRKSKKGKKGKKEESPEDEIPEFEESPASAVAATAAVAGAALASQAQADPVDELDDLDLDMDLDLDLDDDPTPAAEIDLSEMEAVDESELGGSEIDSVLDDILDEDVSGEPQEADDLDALLDSDADIDTDLDELLETDLEDDLLDDESLDDAQVSDAPLADESLEDDELEGLEFAVADNFGEEAVAEEAADMIDEEFFSEEIEPESDQVTESAEIEDSELIDEPIEMDKPNEDAPLDTVSEDDEIDDLVDDDLDKMLLADAAELETEQNTDSATEASTALEFEAPDLDAEEMGIEELGVDEEFPPELESAAGLDQMVSVDDNEAVEDDDLLELGDFDTSLSLDDEPLEDAELATDSLEGLTLDDGDSFDEAPAELADVAASGVDDLDTLPETDLDEVMQDLSNEMAIDEPERPKSPGELVEDELTANIAHDLDMSLEDELDEMLAEDDGDIELVEEGDDEDLLEDDLLDSLDGADEVETKLDLARAYIEMDDTEGARDILGEIARDGNAEQQAEAKSLLDKLS